MTEEFSKEPMYIENTTEAEKQTDPFDSYMTEVIAPAVDEINREKEKYRGQFWTYFWTALFLVSVNALVVLYRALMYHRALNVEQLMLINIVAVVIVCWPLYSWTKHKSQDIFSLFMEFYGQFKFSQTSDNVADVDKDTLIVPEHSTTAVTHGIVGNYDGVDVELRDTSYFRTKSKKSKKVCSGVVLCFDFKQNLKNNLLLFEKFGFYRKSKMTNMINLNEQIHIPASNYFNIFSDKPEVSSFLCSAFFEKILDLKDVFEARKMYLEVTENHIKIFLENSQIYFENNKLWSRKMEYDKFRRLHNQFEEVFIFIETIQAILRDI